MKKSATFAVLSLLAMTGAPRAFAQDAGAAPSEAPRCGGLLCDLGVIGRKSTALPCNDFLCRSAGGQPAPAASPTPEPTPVVAPEPMTPKAKKKRRVKVASPAAQPPAVDAPK